MTRRGCGWLVVVGLLTGCGGHSEQFPDQASAERFIRTSLERYCHVKVNAVRCSDATSRWNCTYRAPGHSGAVVLKKGSADHPEVQVFC